MEEKYGEEKNCLASDNRERGVINAAASFAYAPPKTGIWLSRLAAISRVRKSTTHITAVGLGGEYLHTFYSCWDLGAYPCINLYFLSWNCVVNYDNCCSKYLMRASWIDTTYFNYIYWLWFGICLTETRIMSKSINDRLHPKEEGIFQIPEETRERERVSNGLCSNCFVTTKASSDWILKGEK